jgi:hypothetical protein
MSNPARVEVFDRRTKKCIVSIYCHYDGRPSKLGAELAEFIGGITVVNGIHGDEEMGRTANRIGCLAAQLVAHLKTEVGNVELEPPMTRDGAWTEEYVYRITGGLNNRIVVAVTPGSISMFGKPNDLASFRGLFRGNVAQFKAWCAKQA